MAKKTTSTTAAAVASAAVLTLSGCGTVSAGDTYGLSPDTRSIIDSGIAEIVADGSCQKHQPSAASAFASGVLYVIPGLDQKSVDAYALDSLERQCTDTAVDAAATPSGSEPAPGEPGSALSKPDPDAGSTTRLNGTSDPNDRTIAPYAPGVDQWPDGTRVDFKPGAERQFSQWHMDEAMRNWYPNQATICETVTYNGPLTLIQEIVDFYEGTGQVFGDDAYSIGFATSIVAVNHCPNAYTFVADEPKAGAREAETGSNSALPSEETCLGEGCMTPEQSAEYTFLYVSDPESRDRVCSAVIQGTDADVKQAVREFAAIHGGDASLFEGAARKNCG